MRTPTGVVADTADSGSDPLTAGLCTEDAELNKKLATGIFVADAQRPAANYCGTIGPKCPFQSYGSNNPSCPIALLSRRVNIDSGAGHESNGCSARSLTGGMMLPCFRFAFTPVALDV